MKLAILAFVAALLAISGCSHQATSLTWGTRMAIGVDPQTFVANISYTDGFSLLDLARENSGWEIEVDSELGLVFDKDANTLTGIKKIKRFIGPQMTGFLVDLSKENPEFALEYAKAVRAYWEAMKSETSRD